jgi:uncharacterized protein YheU (UPF0270 family)
MEQPPPDAPNPDAALLVPWQELSAQALAGVIESFVLREGTDYGEREVPFDHKVAAVRRQLERGEAQITFDPETDSVGIVVTSPRQRRP